MRLILIKLLAPPLDDGEMAHLQREMMLNIGDFDPGIRVDVMRANGHESCAAWDLAVMARHETGASLSIQDGGGLSECIAEWLGERCACIKAWSFL